jgi:hypothetical protein
MASRPIADLAVKVGEYEKNGQTKSRNKRIGSLMETDDGRRFILLDATVVTMELNYIANRDRRSEMIVSVFDLSNDTESAPPKSTSAPQRQSPGGSAAASSRANDLDDEIPF